MTELVLQTAFFAYMSMVKAQRQGLGEEAKGKRESDGEKEPKKKRC